jgi:hypothetical protein
MKKRFLILVVSCAAVSLFCTMPVKKETVEKINNASAALKSGDFYSAHMLVNDALAESNNDPLSHLIRAITQYYITTHRLMAELKNTSSSFREINVSRTRYLLSDAENDLSRVQDDLEAALRDKNIFIELKPSSWVNDWDMDGQIDEDDAVFSQVERDEHGESLAEGDPRRTPTIRFDYGDVQWALAYIHFHRAVFDLILAYDWAMITRFDSKMNEDGMFTIKLISPERMAQMRGHLLAGLSLSNESRKSYLAETDDDREWIPNPGQKSRAMPMPASKELYATWETIVTGLQKIMKGEEGLELSALFNYMSKDGGKSGCIDIGGMLSHPKDIELDIAKILKLSGKDDYDAIMREIFGKFYRTDMKPSTSITKETLRMSNEVKNGAESFSDKMRYLLWIN